MQSKTTAFDQKLISIIEELSNRGIYTLKSDKGTIRVYDINSLLYIPLPEFTQLTEEIIEMSLPQHADKYIKSKIYVENVSNFIPTVSDAVCTNFLEGKLFGELYDFFLRNGGMPWPEESKASSKRAYELDDADLYKKILEDDGFLYKHMQRKLNNAPAFHARKELFKDPYENIQSYHSEPVFSSEEVAHLRNNDIFSTSTKLNDIFGLKQIRSPSCCASNSFSSECLRNPEQFRPFVKPRESRCLIMTVTIAHLLVRSLDATDHLKDLSISKGITKCTLGRNPLNVNTLVQQRVFKI